MESPIQIDKKQIAGFCRKHHIMKLALFGSVLTERFGPDSDVDVLVEFHPSNVPGLFALSGMMPTSAKSGSLQKWMLTTSRHGARAEQQMSRTARCYAKLTIGLKGIGERTEKPQQSH
jgi:hypothetical protein